MGEEFQRTFGGWLDGMPVKREGITVLHHFHNLVFEIFLLRLKLAQKNNTDFARQVLQGRRELWRERYVGAIEGHAYSYAVRKLPSTKMFFRWCVQYPEVSNQKRIWDEDIKRRPSAPFGPHAHFRVSRVWAHFYEPNFAARVDGGFFFRRLHVGPDVYLVEHPDNRWVPNVRQEAQDYWHLANELSRPLRERAQNLARFEWLWFWTNPFGRAGPLTGDAMSLLAQKQMLADGLPAHIRPAYYPQACEAFLLSCSGYTQKRVDDILHGFQPRFKMEG